MPLEWLVSLVLGGIGGAALLTWALGWSRPFRIGDEATARAEWLRHWPDDRVETVHLAPDGQAALVLTGRGRGLLRSFGADTVAHYIRAATATETVLSLDFGDFGSPPARLRLDAGTLALWTRALEDRP